jgi:hypothetical protein
LVQSCVSSLNLKENLSAAVSAEQQSLRAAQMELAETKKIAAELSGNCNRVMMELQMRGDHVKKLEGLLTDTLAKSRADREQHVALIHR